MKRLVPTEVTRLHGWLLMKKRFDDANFIGDIMNAMKQNVRLDTKTTMRFAMLLKEFQRIEFLQGMFRG